MRRTELSAALLAALALSAGCGTSRTPPLAAVPSPGPESERRPEEILPPVAASPKPFSPEGGGFRVEMPGTPRERTESAALPDGGSMKAHVYDSSDRAARLEYMVAYSEFPKGGVASLGTEKEALDSGAQGLVVPLRGQIKSRGPASIDGRPGLEVRFETPREKERPPWRGVARIYLVGDRFYQMCAFGPADTFPADRAEAFLKSFTLTVEK